jgi:CO dehydrogenase maturation factor
VSNTRLIINRVPTGSDGQPTLPLELSKFIDEKGLTLAGLIPLDPMVAEYDVVGRPLVQLPQESPARRAVEAAFDSLDGLL